MFAVIRHYHFDKKDSAEIDRLIISQSGVNWVKWAGRTGTLMVAPPLCIRR